MLLTDFGENHYVGQMKLVLNNLLENPNIIDLSHKIEPQNIKQAAFILKKSIKFVPQNSLIQVVIDPGVGSERKILLAELDEKLILAPNNGLFYPIKDQLNKIWEYNGKLVTDWDISNTFHGRDIFSPLTSEIINNKSKIYFDEITIDRLENLELLVSTTGNETLGEILYHDHFGNAVTNIDIENSSNKFVEFRSMQMELQQTFSSVKSGEAIAYKGSFGTVELAIRNDSFQRTFNSKREDKVKLYFLVE